jgi:hypothetical protein
LSNNCTTVAPGQTLKPWQQLGLKLVSRIYGGRDVAIAIDLTESVGLNAEGRLRLTQIIQDSLQSGDTCASARNKNMSRRSLYTSPKQIESSSIFQSFTDLMSNAFMILCFFLLLVLFQSHQLNQDLKEANKRLSSASPIIIDESSGKFQFRSGSAELTPQLKNHIVTNINPQIKDIIKEREIDFIQVIGHTDGEGINQNSNLDKTLEIVAQGTQPVSKLYELLLI